MLKLHSDLRQSHSGREVGCERHNRVSQEESLGAEGLGHVNAQMVGLWHSN